MGLCMSEEEKAMAKKNKVIDMSMRQDYLDDTKIIKLLLLGAGECGKSTILKQMK